MLEADSLHVSPLIRSQNRYRTLEAPEASEMESLVQDRKCRMVNIGTSHVQATDRQKVVFSR
jgi:hypothetical protein